jgi:4-amino-4-deoxy-L-arabinose transferase-like glycosyltransferase
MPSVALRRILIALVGLASLAYLVNLGASSIWDANEAYYVETPREMIESGNYITPTFNYEPRTNKPVLSYWIVAGLYHFAGVSVAAERVAIAAAALIVIAATFFLARAVSPYAIAGLIAALGLAANPRFFMFGRRILVDVLLGACITLTLLFFVLAERQPARRRLFLLLMYASVGLGMLTKGPVAAVLPAAVFFLYLMVHGGLSRLRSMMLPAGTLVVLAIVVPWYVALYNANGWEPIASFFGRENFDRYTSDLGVTRSPFYYVPIVFSDGLPWSLLLPAALVFWFRERRERAADPHRRFRTLLLIWIAVFVGVFSLSGTKQDLYILPIVPAVAVLGADLLSRGVVEFGGRASKAIAISLAIAGLVLAAAGAAVFYIFAPGSAYVLQGTVLLGVLGIGGGLATVALARKRSGWAAVALAASLVGVNWTLALRVLPSVEKYKPVPPLSDAILARVQPGDVIVHYDVALPSMVYYLRRRVESVSPGGRDDFLARARSGATVFGVMPEGRYEEIKNELGPSACVLGRQPTLDSKLRDIIARRPPPTIVLVSTRCN